VNAADIKDLKIEMQIPADIRRGIAANKYRNVIFEVRIYDETQQYSTLEGRVDYEKNIATLKGKTSLTLWVQKPGGGSDFKFRESVGDIPSELDGKNPNSGPVAFEAVRLRGNKSQSKHFKVKAKITPYWIVRTVLGPQEKGAPFYYANETVPVLTLN